MRKTRRLATPGFLLHDYVRSAGGVADALLGEGRFRGAREFLVGGLLVASRRGVARAFFHVTGFRRTRELGGACRAGLGLRRARGEHAASKR